MPLTDLADQQKLFLRGFGVPSGPSVARARAFQDALSSAVLHNALYAPATKASQRHEVIAEWKQMLANIASGYAKRHGVSYYEQDLIKLTAQMNRRFGQYFRQARHPKFGYEPGFRISHAQMSLGLVLKHYWCMGTIEMPPQCPVSRAALVAAHAGELNSKWNDVNAIEAHRAKMKWIKAAADAEGLSVAEWELKVVNAK
jgi:hypothetical protein